MNPAKAKGDRAEREAAVVLATALRRPVRRLLGAGRADDIGDLVGINDWALQVAWWPSDTLRAIRTKPLDAVIQASRSGKRHAAAMIRLVGGTFVIVMTPDEFAKIITENETLKAKAATPGYPLRVGP